MWEAFAEEKEPSESADGSAAEAAKEKTAHETHIGVMHRPRKARAKTHPSRRP